MLPVNQNRKTFQMTLLSQRQSSVIVMMAALTFSVKIDNIIRGIRVNLTREREPFMTSWQMCRFLWENLLCDTFSDNSEFVSVRCVAVFPNSFLD